MKIVRFSLIIFLIICFNAFPQTNGNKFGLVFHTNSGSSLSDIGFSFWFDKNIAFEPIISYQNINYDGKNIGTSINPGIRFLYHFGQRKIKPYLGIGYRAAILSGSGESYADNIIGIIYGGEYILTQWFSIGGEFQLKHVITDEDFSPLGYPGNSNITVTQSTIILRLYFR